MLFCDACRVQVPLQPGSSITRGRCQFCGTVGDCHHLPSGEVPEPPPSRPVHDGEPTPRERAIEAMRAMERGLAKDAPRERLLRFVTDARHVASILRTRPDDAVAQLLDLAARLDAFASGF